MIKIKGLELAEAYFRELGLPLIEKKFPLYKDRIAAGLVGEGSECLGFDDKISRDHDWGPSFCLWLTHKDYTQIGRELGLACESLPPEFQGIAARNCSRWGNGRTGVFEITEFYRQFIAYDHPPVELNQWRVLPESNLAKATNGKVFQDPQGEFTKFRNHLKAFYPEDIRIKKIAARCMKIAQSGQYNYSRCLRRNDAVAATLAESEFIHAVISIIFLLNKAYCPFYKWMHRALLQLPILGSTIYDLVFALEAVQRENSKNGFSKFYNRKIDIIERISAHIIAELKRQSMSNASSDFLLDHGPVVQQKIKDPEIRAMNVWIE